MLKHCSLRRMVVCRSRTLVIGGGLFAQCASAQIIVGQTAGFTGAVAPRSRRRPAAPNSTSIGQRQGWRQRGQKIEHVMLDDQVRSQARRRQRPHADQRTRRSTVPHPGTPHNEQIIPVLDELKVPLVGPPLAPCCCTNRSVAMSSMCARLISARRKRRSACSAPLASPASGCCMSMTPLAPTRWSGSRPV